MKNWKKLASLLLALVLCLSLTACGGDGKSAPATIEDLVLDDSVAYDYNIFLGTWLGEDGSTLGVGVYDEDGWVHFELADNEGFYTAGGELQYVEKYGCVYAYNEYDGIGYQCRFGEDATLYIDTLGAFGKVSGDAPWDGMGDVVEEPQMTADMTGFTGCWKMDSAPLYFVINDSYEWVAINVYGEQIGPGYAVPEDGYVTLYMEDGSEAITLWKNDDGTLRDEDNLLVMPSEYIMLLPTPEDPLNQTTYFSDGFTNVSIDYPIQLDAHPHPSVSNSVDFNAVMEDGTEDYYSNILMSFGNINGYDKYMEKGAAIAEPYMMKLFEDFSSSMFGSHLIKSVGTDFKDCGDYYSITGYMWLENDVFPNSTLNQPVYAIMEVRYYGPTGYAFSAVTIAPESRIQNYYDICCNMLTTLSYTAGWSTAPKSRPSYSGDSGDYGTPYYWYDEDGDIWYWNGHENVFMSYGSDGYIDNDTGEYMESNDAGWDYDDYDYYDDYDPWSDPGDGYDAWSDPDDYGDYYDDGWGDYFD